MYGKNAEIGEEVLGLRMLSKNGSPMVGFPDHVKDEYSAKLFTGNIPDNFAVDPDALEKAGVGEFVFTERKDPLQYTDRIETMIVYFWNRNYPSDIKLSYNGPDWVRTGIAEFPGHSHEKITVEEWLPRG